VSSQFARAHTPDGVCGSQRTFSAYFIDMTLCGLVSFIELTIRTKVLKMVSLEDIVFLVLINTKWTTANSTAKVSSAVLGCSYFRVRCVVGSCVTNR
jgi:hypothetical protein